MSYFDDASLVMIPSGYKTSKVYSVKPTNGTGDLAFTRSNDTATRVGPDGLIQKVRTNLILQSNTFSTTWLNANSTETGGQAGYDGTNNAWKLTASSAGGHIYQDITIAGLVTFSIYAKAGSEIGITLYSGHASQGRYFNLSTGALGGAFANVPLDSKIESIGSGWYRCSITVSATNTNNFRAYVSNGTANVVGDILIQAAQVETGDIATEPILTTTAAVSVGPVANVPRLDYLGSSCPRLLLEPQRTNSLTYSEQIDNADWLKLDVTIAANTSDTLDPAGYNGSDKITDNSTNGAHFVYRYGSWDTTQRTASVYAKAGTSSRVCIVNATINAGVFANLTTGTISVSAGFTGTITSVGNGWYRITATHTAASSQTFTIGLFTGTNTTDYIGTGSYAYLWGAQLEEGAYATSYVNTLNSAVTRGADDCSKTGISSLIGQTEGTMFLELSSLSDSVLNEQIALSDGSDANTIKFVFGSVVGGVKAEGKVASVGQFGITKTTSDFVSNKKIAVAYKANDFVFYYNGEQVGVDTGGTVPAMSAFAFSTGASTFLAAGNVKQTLLFKTRLTNAQLAELTTI